MQVGWCTVGQFLPVNDLRLTRTTVADVCSTVHPPGGRCYCYQQHPLEVAYDDNVYNANDVGLKAHSHRGDINEVSRQFIAVLLFSRGDVNGL